jgi:hypothetical protein
MIAFSRFLLHVSAAIIALLAVIGALTLLGLGSAAVIRIVVPNSEVVRGTVLSGPVAWAQSLQPQAETDEAQAAREPNLAMRNWAVTCRFATIDKNDFVYSTNPTDNPIFDHLKLIANALFNDRVVLANAIDRTFTVLEWAAMASILIGLATTICAGLRSDDQALGSWTRRVRILAVVFPALGTAVASVTSFYGPREELLRVSQALVTLQELHSEIQLGLSREPCPIDGDGRTKILKKFEDWEDKLIQQRPATIAARIATRANDLGRGGGNSGYQPLRISGQARRRVLLSNRPPKIRHGTIHRCPRRLLRSALALHGGERGPAPQSGAIRPPRTRARRCGPIPSRPRNRRTNRLHVEPIEAEHVARRINAVKMHGVHAASLAIVQPATL